MSTADETLCWLLIGAVRVWDASAVEPLLGRPAPAQRLMGRRVLFTPRISKYGARREAGDRFVHRHHRSGMLSKIAPIMKQKQM